MAERKTDFLGEVYGNWKVTERKPAALGKGKRCWEVTNMVTEEVKIVLQTALTDLVDETKQGKLLAQATGRDEWAVELPESDAREYELPEILGDFTDQSLGITFDDQPVEDTDATDDFEGSAVPIGYDGKRNSDGKIPGNNKGNLELEPGWAEKAVAVMGGPIKPITGVKDVLANLGVEVPEKNIVHQFGGIGEAAEDGVSEAELDGRVPAPDPVRTSIRALMGQVHDLRGQIEMLGGMIESMMELVDDAMKAAITR